MYKTRAFLYTYISLSPNTVTDLLISVKTDILESDVHLLQVKL